MTVPIPSHTAHPRSRKPVIGLLGGPGSGKSTIASLFMQLGCAVIDADQLAHEALKTPHVQDQIRQRWGDSVFDERGAGINRAALGHIVFADPQALRQLEAIIHPIVHQSRQHLREQYLADPTILAIVEDCPLLLESKLDQECDALVFIDTPDHIRLQRVRDARGWDENELKKRDARQLPLDIKREAADYVLKNVQDTPEMRLHVRHVLQNIINSTPE